MKRIEKLTPEQEARMPEWRDKWIQIGLRTGETDWETFEKYIRVCYQKAGLGFPERIVRVSSPLVGAFASSIANKLLKSGAVGGAVGGAVAVYDAVGGAVGGAVYDAVGGAVDGAVYDAVGGAVDGAVRDAVGSAVGSAVGGAVGGAEGDWHYWFGGQFWVGGWSWYGSPSMVSFFTDVCGLELDKDIQERATAYRKVCESVNYVWANSHFVMVCARPTKINRDALGQLHSDREKSIEYPDGWGLYHLHGVSFHKELWEKVTSRKMPFAEILAIKDIDQRKQAMKYGNVWEFIEFGKAKELDTHVKIGAADGRKIHYWLYQFPANPDLFPNGATYAVYEDSMLGAAEIHMQGIDPKINAKTVPEAMAWKQSDNLYSLTPEQWEELVLDEHFT